jgi:hypothetical protein
VSDAIDALLACLDELVQRLGSEHVAAAIAAAVGYKLTAIDAVPNTGACVKAEVLRGLDGVEVLHNSPAFALRASWEAISRASQYVWHTSQNPFVASFSGHDSNRSQPGV